MPIYSWKGKNKLGKMQEGTVTAENKDAVIALLRGAQYPEHRSAGDLDRPSRLRQNMLPLVLQ